MKRKSNTWWILAAALPFFMQACKTRQLEYLGFENPKMEQLGFPHSTLSIQVNCYNPNKFGMRLISLTSDVYINNNLLGVAFLDSGINIPRNDSFRIPVKLKVETGRTLDGLRKMFSDQNDSIPVLLKLEGNARLRKSGVLIKYPIHYEEEKIIKF